MSDIPVVLLHGTNAGPWTMAPFKKFFEEAGFACHAPTYRFHHLADGEERRKALIGTSIQDYVSDTVEFIRTLDRPPIVIGHSLGGLIAQILSGRGLIEAGVLINSSIMAGTTPTTDMERALGRMFMSAGAFWQEAPGQDFELLAAYGLNTMPEIQQHEICDRLSTESGEVLFELFFWMYDQKQATQVVFDGRNAPMLFLTGGEDKVVPPSTARQMAARYGDLAALQEYPGKCHYMHLEDGWQELASNSLVWIRETVSRKNI